MSIKLMSEVWELPELKGAIKLVLLTLADHANDEGRCWPSTPRIAHRSSVSERHAVRVIDWLVDNGYVCILEQGNGRGKPPLYQVTPLNGSYPQKDDTMSSDDPKKGDTVTLFGRKKDDTMSSKKDDMVSEKGDICAQKGDICDITYIEEPSIESPIEPSAEEGIVGAAPTPPAADAWNDWVEQLCQICHGHSDLEILTASSRGALLREAKAIREADFSPSDLVRWFERVWIKDWRWKKDKQLPKPHEVRESLPRLQDEATYSVDPPAPMPQEVDFMEDKQPAYPPPTPKPPPTQPPATNASLAISETWALILPTVMRAVHLDMAMSLETSQLVEAGEVGPPGASVPLYRVQITKGDRKVVEKQCAKLIMRELKSALGYPVQVEVVNAQPTPEMELVA